MKVMKSIRPQRGDVVAVRDPQTGEFLTATIVARRGESLTLDRHDPQATLTSGRSMMAVVRPSQFGKTHKPPRGLWPLVARRVCGNCLSHADRAAADRCFDERCPFVCTCRKFVNSAVKRKA